MSGLGRVVTISSDGVGDRIVRTGADVEVDGAEPRRPIESVEVGTTVVDEAFKIVNFQNEVVGLGAVRCGATAEDALGSRRTDSFRRERTLEIVGPQRRMRRQGGREGRHRRRGRRERCGRCTEDVD